MKGNNNATVMRRIFTLRSVVSSAMTSVSVCRFSVDQSGYSDPVSADSICEWGCVLASTVALHGLSPEVFCQKQLHKEH